MNDTYNQLLQLMNKKMQLIDMMLANTIQQSAAIANSDDHNLTLLINARQQLIDQVDKINKVIEQHSDAGRIRDETQLLEEKMQLKFREVYKIDQKNIIAAQKVKNELLKNIKQISLGKKALDGGYFKEEIQTSGYFIDSKIGK